MKEPGLLQRLEVGQVTPFGVVQDDEVQLVHGVLAAEDFDDVFRSFVYNGDDLWVRSNKINYSEPIRKSIRSIFEQTQGFFSGKLDFC